MSTDRLWLLIGGTAWLLFFAATLSIPASQFPELVPQVVSILIGITLLIAILLAAERPYWPAWMRIVLLCCGVLFVGAPYLLGANEPGVKAFVALGLLMVALPVGYWIGDRMEKVTNLVPLAIGMSLADLYSVSQGFSRRVAADVTLHQEEVARVISEHAPQQGMTAAINNAAQLKPPLADFIIVHLPIAGTGMSQPVLGIGDFVILAFIFRSAWVHGIPARAVFWPALISVVAALALSQTLGVPLPALPFIALGCVGWLWLAHPRIRNLDRQEVLLSITVAAVFLALFAYRYVAALFGQPVA
jgi:hypothetical protein